MTDTSGLRPFLAEFWRFDRRATLYSLSLNLTGALLEGMGLLLLLPLLNLAGVLGAEEGGAASLTASHLPAAWTRWLDALPQHQRLVLMLSVFVGLITLQATVSLLRERQSQRLQLRFVDHLRDVLFGSLARARWSFLSRHHSSEFLSVLTADVNRVGLGTIYLLQLFTQFAVFPVYLAVAFKLSPPVTGLALLTGAVLWWILRKSRDVAKQNGLIMSKANQSLYNELQEFLGALKLIKIHGEEAGYQRQFAHVVDHLREHQLAFNVVRSRSQLTYRIGGAAALAALTYAALVWVRLPAASLLVLIAIFSRMLPQVSQIHMALQQLWHMSPAFRSWARWVALCDEAREAPHDATAPVSLREGIHAREVLYRHPSGHQIFEIQNLFIPARRTTAVTGPTGSGKTTFLDLVCGLNLPSSGTLTVDGQPLAALPGWRHRIAYVPQDTAILDGTIRDNLTFGSDGPSDTAMLAALGRAAAVDFVLRLPAGLDTWVGERGVRLSGGEKQRLALARALLREPELLILDEATSALDRGNQQIILEALRTLHGRMTVLIVTHRFEEIIDLIDGMVKVEAGQVGPWTPVRRGNHPPRVSLGQAGHSGFPHQAHAP